MSETKWSPEPWRVSEDDGPWPGGGQVRTADGEFMFTASNADARRIVACVNALAGVPTEALEAGVVSRAVAALCGPSEMGHHVGTAGIRRCPECHHPQGAPWHSDDCKIGKVLRELGRLP